MRIGENSYSNTSQLDLWGGGDLRGSQADELGLELLEILLESILALFSELIGLHLLGLRVLHFSPKSVF